MSEPHDPEGRVSTTPRSPQDGGDADEALRTVHRTAVLARLSIDPDEERRLAGDFARILASFHALAEVDVGAAPDEIASGESAPVARRADEPAPFPGVKRLLDAAPEPIDADGDGGRFFGVPKTLGGPA